MRFAFLPVIIGIILISAVVYASPLINMLYPNDADEVISQNKGNNFINFNVQSSHANPYVSLHYDPDTNPDNGNGIPFTDNPIFLNTPDLCDDLNFLDLTGCSYGWDTTGINGSYFVQAALTGNNTVYDWTDNYFIVDNNSPLITNVSPGGGWTNSNKIAFNVLDSESDVNSDSLVLVVDGNTYSVSDTTFVDASNYFAFTFPYTPAQGPLIDVSIDVRDLGNNAADTNTFSFGFDINSPGAAIIEDSISDDWVVFDEIQYNCSDNASGCLDGIWYYLEESSIDPCSSNKDDYIYTSSANITINWTNEDTNGYLCILAEDNAGNIDTDKSTKRLLVDLNYPTTSVLFSGNTFNGWLDSGDATISCTDHGIFDVNVSGCASINYGIDGNVTTVQNDANAEPFIHNITLPDGNYEFSRGSLDRTGMGWTIGTPEFLVDSTPPTSASISVAQYTNDFTPELTISASDATSGVYEMAFSCDNVQWTGWEDYTTSYSLFDITDNSFGCDFVEGTKTIYLKVRDRAHNELDANTQTFFDFAVPNSLLSSSVPSDWQQADFLTTISCNDGAGSGFDFIEYWVDGTYFVVNAFDVNVSFTSDGNHEFIHSCTDLAGNRDFNETFFIPIDKTPPETTLTPSGWQTSDFNAVLTASDVLSGYNKSRFQLDNDASGDVNLSEMDSYQALVYSIPITEDGNWAIEFDSMDLAGNNEATNTGYLLLDSTPPNQPSFVNWIEAQNSDDVLLDWSDPSDATSGVDYFVVWRATSDDTSPAAFSAISTVTDSTYLDEDLAMNQAYEHCYKIQTFDIAGNDVNSEIQCIWLDSTPPVIGPVTSDVSNDSVIISYSASDTDGSGVSHYWVSADSNTGPWTQTTLTSHTFSSQSNATHTYFVIATDNADNNSIDANTVATVNYTPPSPAPSGDTSGGGGGGGAFGSSSPTTVVVGFCGDGNCSDIEDCELCELDCGACPPEPTPAPEPETSAEPEPEIFLDACTSMDCGDENECTIDSCAEGVCSNTNVENGSACEGGSCHNGVCLEEPDTPTGFFGLGNTELAAIIFAIVLAALGFVYWRRSLNNSPFG